MLLIDADVLLRRCIDHVFDIATPAAYLMPANLPLAAAVAPGALVPDALLGVDPWTGAPATRGLLRFYDLANHQTVLAIETADVGVVHADGSVRLEGRIQGARPRGCSLSVEEAHA